MTNLITEYTHYHGIADVLMSVATTAFGFALVETAEFIIFKKLSKWDAKVKWWD